MISRIRSRWRSRHLKGAPAEKIFTDIYRSNAWGGASVSGMGSDPDQTASLRASLPQLLRRHAVGSILDVPCGDFNWMKEIPLGGISYLGGDIVEDLVTRNRRNHEGPNRGFFTVNLLKETLPAADLLVCRDCLIHLSLEDIAVALGNITRSPIRFLLTTNYPMIRKNGDIVTGDFRAINLRIPPFSFPEPIEVIPEDSFPEHAGNPNFIRELALWRVGDLAGIIAS